MENLNKKYILIGGVLLIILIALGFYFYQPSSNIKNQTELNKDNLEEYSVSQGDPNVIDSYFKNNLTDLEKENLKALLAEREEKLNKIKNILDEAYKKGDMEDAWMEVNKMRDEIKFSLLPYVADEKKGDFEAFCYQQAEAFDSVYVQK